MNRIASSAGVALAFGLGIVLAAALAPAGLNGRPIPVLSWAIWGAAFTFALATLSAAGWSLGRALRRVLWFVPLVVLLALPAALVAAPGHRVAFALALGARALAAASAGAALAVWLGPAGLVAGLRRLRIPARLVEVLAAALASLATVMRQVQAMLRAREARRPGYGAWASLVEAPGETARSFGRLVAALLLRSLERAEALDRARRARGAAEL
jgi:energy-coupling factor transporter transmembrane protein EcfT